MILRILLLLLLPLPLPLPLPPAAAVAAAAGAGAAAATAMLPGVSEVVRLTEVSFFHKASRTLLVTDAVLFVDKDPPACIPEEVR